MRKGTNRYERTNFEINVIIMIIHTFIHLVIRTWSKYSHSLIRTALHGQITNISGSAIPVSVCTRP